MPKRKTVSAKRPSSPRSPVPDTPTGRLVQIGFDLVETCDPRDLRAWKIGHRVCLRDGQTMHSHTRRFREILALEYSRRHGEAPSFAAINGALGIFGTCKFQDRHAKAEAEKGRRGWSLTVIDGHEVESFEPA